MKHHLCIILLGLILITEADAQTEHTMIAVSARSVTEVQFAGPSKTGNMLIGSLDEVSGLVTSRANKGLLWLHNDSGDDAVVYAMKPNGAVICTVAVQGAKHVDWEDMAIGPKGKDSSYLYLADIGDNQADRKSVTIYRIVEPTIPDRQTKLTMPCEAFRFTYPDGPRDAEALIVDPVTDDWYIITKREKRSRVYKAAAPRDTSKTVKLTYVTELPFSLVTAADITPSGREILVKTYLYMYHWVRPLEVSLDSIFNKKPEIVRYMPEPQGEAVGWTPSGNGYYTVSELTDRHHNVEVNLYKRTSMDDPSTFQVDFDRPYIAVNPSRDTKGIYEFKYIVNTVSKVEIALYNEAMMRIDVIEPGVEETGSLEREIDMIDRPDGHYVVIIRAGKSYNAIPFEVRRD
jgi:hypothetical protein